LPASPNHTDSWELELLLNLEIVVFRDVGNTDNQDPHSSPGAVNNAWRDMHQGALGNRLLDAVEKNAAATIKDIVKFGGTFMKMQFGSVDVDRVGPSGGG